MNRRFVGASVAAALAVAPALLATGAAAADIPFVKSQQPGEWMAYRLVGTKVLNGKGDIVGRVSDVVLDASGNATAVVIGIGGVAGYGDKLVAVPFKAVYIGDVTHSSRVVVLDVTKEQLQGAPTYDAKDPTATARLKAKASDWAKAAKEKAIELGNAAAEKAKEMKDGTTTPSTTPSTTPPSPPSPPAQPK
jgi:sporulation protein YlmC with PRC-barrel domain